MAPVAMSSIIRGNSGSPPQPFNLVRREYIADIAGSVTFANTAYSLNPGLSATFPWGSGIAPNYEEYECKSISFVYEPESATTATGAIILSFDYDALDAAPTTKQEALEISDSIRSAPWVNSRLALKTTDLQKRGTLFTRTATVSGSDLKTYDLGNLNVSTVGQAGTTVIGELWIEYHFVLRIPQPTPSSASTSGTSAKIAVSTGISASAAFGSAAVVTGTTSVTAVTNTLTFTSTGDFLLWFTYTGSGMAAAAAPAATGTATSASISSVMTGGSSDFTVHYRVQVTAAGQTFIPNFAALGTPTSGFLRISTYTYTNA